MDFLKIAILVVLVFICIFTLVDRICKCCEQCALSKAYGEFIKGKSNKSFKAAMEDIKNETESKLH